MGKNQYKLPIVRGTFAIIHSFQFFTSTFFINCRLESNKRRGVQGRILNNSTSKGIITSINIIWLLFSAFIVISGLTSCWVLVLGIFRLWEILIINLELFVFKQSAESPNCKISSKENNIRLFLLLVFQFFTVIFIYTFIFQYLYNDSAQNYYITLQQNVMTPSAVTWLHYSIGNISNTSFGNVVPLSDTVRIIAISEIVYGYVFILLFISSMASKLGFKWIIPHTEKVHKIIPQAEPASMSVVQAGEETTPAKKPAVKPKKAVAAKKSGKK